MTPLGPRTVFLIFSLNLLALASVVGELAAQARDPLQGWEERFLAEGDIPVSGSLRVGVMAGGTAAAVDPMQFHVLLPKGTSGRLCVEISSRDGRYEMRNLKYDLSGLPAGGNRFHLPTEHARDLSQYSTAELAILAWIAPGCATDDQEFVVASWKSVEAPGTISVLLNSNVPTFLLARSRDGARLGETACHEISAVRSRAYNRRCDIPAEWVRQATLVLRKRERRASRSVYVSVPLTIIWPTTSP